MRRVWCERSSGGADVDVAKRVQVPDRRSARPCARRLAWPIAGVLATLSAPAVAETVEDQSVAQSATIEKLTPGAAAALPEKATLARRESTVVATMGAQLFAGGSTIGVDAIASLRLADTLGFGLGLRGSNEGGVFMRIEALGLAINHWAFLGYADYVFGDAWSIGGAMIAPLRRDLYVRASIASGIDTGNLTFGVGMERDVW